MNTLRILSIATAVAISLIHTAVAQQQLTVSGYNTESGDAQQNTLTTVIGELQTQTGCDIWGFSEVLEAWEEPFRQAAANASNANFQSILGTTGGNDRPLILFNADRLQLVGQPQELHRINPLARVRAPLVARFRIQGTTHEFLFMVNHLYRGRDHFRHLQAKLLNQWGRGQTLPVIAVGDYNFDWQVGNGDAGVDRIRDRGFDLMTADGVFSWVRPSDILQTQASNFNSVLDFVFVAGNTWTWEAESEIIERGGDFPDNNQKSDHRPVRADFTIP